MPQYTLGIGLRSREEFVEILLAHGIGVLAGVRSVPRSKPSFFCGQGRGELARPNGLDYIFLGKELGGFRTGGYTAHMATGDFSTGVSLLEEVGRTRTTAFIGAERLPLDVPGSPWMCHRKWISLELKRRGWQVRHIIDNDRVWEPQ